MTRRLSIVVALLVAAGPLVAQGARPHTREGFWIGFGGGWGSAGAECTDCGNDRETGFGGYLRAGGTVSPSVLLGGEANGWMHSESGVDQNLGFLSFIAQFYPSRDGGFYLKVGIGGMSYKADNGSGELTATAPAGVFGAGYEFRVGRNMSIVPYFNSLASSAVEFEINGVAVPSDNLRITLFQLGVGLTWH